MPSIKIGNFRLSIMNESKPTYKYMHNGKYQSASPGLLARNAKIHELHLKGATQAEIAKKVGIGQARVSSILIEKFNVKGHRGSNT